MAVSYRSHVCCGEFESSETPSPEVKMGRHIRRLPPLEDYFHTQHGLILPAELASAVVQDGV